MKEEKRKKPTKKFTADTWSWDSVSHSAEIVYVLWLGLPQGAAGDMGSVSGSGKIPWKRAWQPTPVFLPGESQGQRSLLGYSP